MVSIKPSDRVTFVGKTGSGKTYAARILTKNLRRLVVFDPKGTLRGKWDLKEWTKRTAKDLRDGKDVRVRIPAPIDGNWEQYFQACYEAQDVTVYIDEVYGVLDKGNRASPYFTALYTRGRELNIGVWACTQRPAWMPLFVLSEAEWIFLFRLQLDADRKRMSEIMGDSVRHVTLTGHEFYLYNQSWDSPVKYPRITSRRDL